MKPNKALSMLGLAMKAGRVMSGTFMVEKAVRAGKAYMLICAVDASDNAKKNFRNMCGFYRVPYFEYGTKEELGHAVGKGMRVSLVVTDAGFAKSLKKHLEETGNETEVGVWQK